MAEEAPKIRSIDRQRNAMTELSTNAHLVGASDARKASQNGRPTAFPT